MDPFPITAFLGDDSFCVAVSQYWFLCDRFSLTRSLAGKFSLRLNLSGRDVATAIIGGLMMGYGARLAYGCNIGAYLGGLVSGSLHGWWWLFWGFLGSYAGTWVRERAGIDPPSLFWRARAA